LLNIPFTPPWNSLSAVGTTNWWQRWDVVFCSKLDPRFRGVLLFKDLLAPQIQTGR